MGHNTKVKSYTTEELLNKVQSLDDFMKFPDNFWILGVRSNEDTPNIFDDKFYIFKNKTFISVMTGTTNPGVYGLTNWHKWSNKGAAVIIANKWYYKVWKRGLHKNIIPALKQYGIFFVKRDNNNNTKSGDAGKISWENYKGLNFHPNTYDITRKFKTWLIGKWSTGCQVVNDIPKYKEFMNITKPQKYFTYCLIDEF